MPITAQVGNSEVILNLERQIESGHLLHIKKKKKYEH